MNEHVDQLLAVMRRLQELRLGRPRLREIEPELSWPQMALLAYLNTHPGSHVQDIAEGVGITSPSASVALRKLEEDGWLERKPDPDDKRATLIFLTGKSEAVVQAMHAQARIGAGQFLEGLAEDEQTQLIRLMTKAISAAEHRRDTQSDISTQEQTHP